MQGRMAIVEQSHGSGKRQASSPDELVAGKPANQPLQFQDAERGQDLKGSQAGAADQLVDADGMVVELAEQGSLLVAEAKLGRVADGGLVRGGVHLANQRAKFLEDVVDRLDQAGAVPDQAVADAAGQAVHRAGHGEDLPVPLHGVVRGGQRPAPRRGHYDHDAQAKAGDDPVAWYGLLKPREMKLKLEPGRPKRVFHLQ